ncbi:unnamed protein product [Litomosoides sigmodontis]|uniref:Acyl-coenzyme A thioesterase 13 n=1 Tax=Litomosoides sigmodontis TaxID=42156 RepID=A0A3P6TJ87_LITSI|nr:unnamed protein product [Litomosoides sigmodontis]
MVDKELAVKLAKRFDKLNFDMYDGSVGTEVSQQTIIRKQSAPLPAPLPPPPPPPPERQQVSPLHVVPENEWTDMDKLIGQTLRNLEVTSHKTSTTMLTSVNHMAQSKITKPFLSMNTTDDTPPQVQLKDNNHFDKNKQSDSSSLSSKCCAPIVPIVHHKSQGAKKFACNDLALQKERDELELKLAKQRQKKSNLDAKIATPFAHNGINAIEDIEDEARIVSEVGKSRQLTTSCNQLPPRTSSISQLPPRSPPTSTASNTTTAITTSTDGSLTELQLEDVRKPSVISQKSTSSIRMNQALSSPTCSTNSNHDDGNELAAKLARRNMIAEGEAVEQAKPPKLSIYSEFHEFTRKQIKYFMETFKKYDEDHDNYIDFNELKRMMEKLGEAQTHIALKNMLKLVDEDQDGKVSPREFMLIFRYASTGQLSCATVFNELAASVDVVKEGVHAAADFFEAKIEEQIKLSKFEEEIRAEQEEKKLEQAERKERRQQFLCKTAQMANRSLQLVREAFKSFDKFSRFVRVCRVVSVNEGAVELEMDVANEHLNSFGHLHEGCMAALVDMVTSVAIMTTKINELGVSINLNMSYPNCAKLGDTVIVNGTLLYGTNKLAHTRAEIRRKSDNLLIAYGQHTKAFPKKS